MPGLAAYRQTIPVGKTVKVRARGTTVFVAQTNVALAVEVRSTQVGGKGGVSYKVTMRQAEKWFTAEEFDTVIIENLGTLPAVIELYLGSGDFFKPVPDIINFAASVPASRNIVTLDDVTNIDIGNAGKISLFPISLVRTRLIITALSTNTDIIRIGDTNIDTDRGIPLQAGESVVVESTAQVFACSEATDDQSAAVYEERT